MNASHVVCLGAGVVLGGLVESLEIGWWSLLVLAVLGFVIGVAMTLWHRRFS